MEARADEAGQVMRGSNSAQMPRIAEARHALAIHGERDLFRTITVQFTEEEYARGFDLRMEMHGDARRALIWRTPGETIQVERRP